MEEVIYGLVFVLAKQGKNKKREVTLVWQKKDFLMLCSVLRG